MSITHRTNAESVLAALKLTGMAAALSFVMMLVMAGCPVEPDPGGGEEQNTEPKTLVIQNVPAPVYAYAQSGGEVGLFPVGTVLEQALAMEKNTIPGAMLSNRDITVTGTGPYTITLPLYKGTNIRWTGSGTYDIGAFLYGDGKHYYRVNSVRIASQTTAVSFNNAAEVFLGGGEVPTPQPEVSVDDLQRYIAMLPANTPESPHTVKLKRTNITTNGVMSLVNEGVANRYVVLDLSACYATNNAISGNYGTPGPDDMNVIKDNEYIVGIILPNELKTIGSEAFSWCGSLASVTIPGSVTSIGNQAFYECSSLASVVIPASVTSIGWGAFSGCDSLESVDIPGSVTSIEDRAFYGCSSLVSVDIPASVTSIGDGAFSGCGSLASVVIPASVTSIGDLAFSGCGSLASVVIPASVTSIGDRAFSWCSSLASVVIPASVTSIGDGAFSWCSSLASVVIPASVTSIGDHAFSRCSSLASVVIPASVTSIGNSTFDTCRSLASVVIPASVTSIGDYAFSECSSLASVTFAEGSNISPENFGSWSFPDGLFNMYFWSESGVGTYTRIVPATNPGWNGTWTKQ
jgi:hypothetical protein